MTRRPGVLVAILVLAVVGVVAAEALPRPGQAQPAPKATNVAPPSPPKTTIVPPLSPSTGAKPTPTPDPGSRPVLAPPQFRPSNGTTWFADAATGWVVGIGCEAAPSSPATQAASTSPYRCHALVDATTDRGKSWHEAVIGDGEPEQIQFVGTAVGWAILRLDPACYSGTCASALYHTADGGKQWAMIYQSASDLVDLSFTSPTDGWVIGRSCQGGGPPPCTGRLLVTHDGGQTWANPAVSLDGEFFVLARPTTADAWILAAGRYGNGSPPLLATHDGGATWDVLPAPANAQGLAFRNAREGWAAVWTRPGIGQEYETDRTSDGGKTWASDGDHWCMCGGRQPDYGDWALAPDGAVLHSNDQGTTWDPSSEARGAYVPVRRVDRLVGWMMVSGHTLLTTDGGRTWQPAPLPPSHRTNPASSQSPTPTRPGASGPAPSTILPTPAPFTPTTKTTAYIDPRLCLSVEVPAGWRTDGSSRTIGAPAGFYADGDLLQFRIVNATSATNNPPTITGELAELRRGSLGPSVVEVRDISLDNQPAYWIRLTPEAQFGFVVTVVAPDCGEGRHPLFISSNQPDEDEFRAFLGRIRWLR